MSFCEPRRSRVRLLTSVISNKLNIKNIEELFDEYHGSNKDLQLKRTGKFLKNNLQAR